MDYRTKGTESYVLRCWREDMPASDAGVWRFALISAETGQRLGFSSVQQVVSWLEAHSTPIESAIGDERPN